MRLSSRSLDATATAAGHPQRPRPRAAAADANVHGICRVVVRIDKDRQVTREPADMTDADPDTEIAGVVLPVFWY